MTPPIVANRHGRDMRTAAATVVAGLGSLAVALAACSSGDTTTATSSTAATSTTAAVCASADAFRSSLSSLADVQVVQEGTDSLKTAWTQVQDDWAQFADDARSGHSDDVDSVQADADAARDAVEAAVADASTQTLAAAGTALTAFVQNAGALVDEVRSTC
jgi:hypothetical protein